MKNRNPLVVLLLSIITFGIYAIVWQVKTKNELNKLGASIPTAWLIIVPLVNLWWLWKYCEGVEHVTNGKLSGILAFVLLFLLGVIGMVILQFEFNKVGNQPMAVGAEPAATPAPGFGPEVAAPVAPEVQPAAPASVEPTVSTPGAPVAPAATSEETSAPQPPQAPQA